MERFGSKRLDGWTAELYDVQRADLHKEAATTAFNTTIGLGSGGPPKKGTTVKVAACFTG